MSEETKEELKAQIERGKCQKEQRQISDEKYAAQKEFSLVQKIVFSLIAIIVLGVIGALINSVVGNT